MLRINVIKTGLIYRNPRPHLRSEHAYFPSVARLSNGDLLCTFVLGEAFEAANCHTFVARSVDGGRTWGIEGEICARTQKCLTSDSVRITALPGGRVVAFMVRPDGSRHPGEGLANPATLGLVPTETLLLWSGHNGHTWGPATPVSAACGAGV